MPRKPLSEAAKTAFIRSRKLYWIRKKLDAEENALRITAPVDNERSNTKKYRRSTAGYTNPDSTDPLGEEVFEREMGIGWKREE